VRLSDTNGLDGAPHRFVRTCGTMTADLLTLGDWLNCHDVTQVAMPWRAPVCCGVLFLLFNVLEEEGRTLEGRTLEGRTLEGRTLILVNAQPIKAVPGRKTDVQDRRQGE